MGTNEKPAQRGARLARKAMAAIGEELRLRRTSVGLSQGEVGRAVGVSRTKISRIERDDHATATLGDVFGIAAVLGFDVNIRLYPSGSPVRDRAHHELLERLHGLLAPTVRWRTEVPLPNPGDLRAWDAVASDQTFRVGVECETRARDGQELERRIALKERDGGVDRVILLLRDTRANRAFVRERRESLRAMFPVNGRRALQALSAGRIPGGNAIVLL